MGLAATKLCPPTLPGRLVRRQRLGDALDDGLADHVRLVLASAPAGSGKSTLLASWLAGRPESSAWLQVESGDSDPARFWAYLIEAIGQAHPALSSALRPVVVGANGDEQVVVPALVNALAELAEPLVIVIDDYHLIDNASVHLGVERLIELCPTAVTVVVSTRVDPPFRIGRLRVRNQVTEIRGDAFRFNTVEASGLLSSGGEPVDETIVEKLCGRTEGWAAGLVLAGLSLRRSRNPGQFIEDFHGDDQLVVDYMTDEFLAGVSDEHRQRLLETSVLEQFNGGLVDAVTGGNDGAAWLRETAQVNQLLIGLDRTGSWFRYHHLLRDLLRLEAQQAFPERLGELRRRAAAWFESEGDLGQAVAYQLAAGDRDDAARLMFVLGPQLLSDGQMETLRSFLVGLGDVAKTAPACALLWGWCEYVAGRYSLAAEWVEVTHDVASASFDQIITAPLRMNIAIAQGDVGAGLIIAREMTATHQFESHGSELATASGGVYMWAGQAAEARATLALAVEKSSAEEVRATHVLGRIYQAIVEFDDNGTGAAAVAALSTADELGMASYYRIGPAYAIRGRTDTNQSSAHADAVHAVELARRIPGDLALAYVLTICGDILIDLGETAGHALLTEARAVIDRCPDPGIAGRYLARIESRHSIAEMGSARVEALVEQLTERETAVLRYLPTKMSQREIAAELYVSLNTVKTHCSAIYRKLGADNRKAAVQAARDHHLL
ncbi:MAG: LuxR family maltose regulon positive regulatory protein [Ilumatobacter sp.]|jgi:LuxR family maltose regulon positive regulatory protein